MGTVPIKEYEGSLVGKALLDGLGSIGILNVINKHKYILEITDDSSVDNEGMIVEDSDKHKITIVKQLHIGNKEECAFVNKGGVVNTDSESYKESIEALESYRLKLPVMMGTKVEEVSHIILMDSKRCYYEHKITIYVSKKDQEGPEEYVERLFVFIADLLVGSRI